MTLEFLRPPTPTPAESSQTSRVKSLRITRTDFLRNAQLLKAGVVSLLGFVSFFRGGLLTNDVSISLMEQPTHKWGWGRLFIAEEQPAVKRHDCPCVKGHKCPRSGPLAEQVPATPHVTRGTVGTHSVSLSSGKLHSQFPDSSTEDRFLSVLKNNVSDTRGTELLLQEISLGFSSGFLSWAISSEISELIFLDPSDSTVFPYDSRMKKKTNEDYASNFCFNLIFLRAPVEFLRNSDSSGFRILQGASFFKGDTSFFNVPQHFGGSTMVVKPTLQGLFSCVYSQTH